MSFMEKNKVAFYGLGKEAAEYAKNHKLRAAGLSVFIGFCVLGAVAQCNEALDTSGQDNGEGKPLDTNPDSSRSSEIPLESGQTVIIGS